MTVVTHSLRAVLVGSLVVSLALPVAPAFSAGGSLGTARGVRAADLSLDGGQRWLPLAGRSLPVVDASRIRTTGGGVMLDLVDGSRVNVLPYSTVSVRETAAGTTIALEYGRLTFRLPAATRVAIETSAARLEPVPTGEMIGEVFASGTTGLKMTAGQIQVRPARSAEPVMVASLDPVFVPSRPAIAGALFTTDAQESLPTSAKSVFNPKGENLGYVRGDGQFIVHPGATADLTSPLAPRTVQVAMANIPARDRAGAEPLFDVNGQYVGYVAGPMFFAQAATPAAPSTSGQAAAGTPAAGSSGVSAGVVGGLAAILGVAGLGIAASAINDSGKPATPGQP